jgi:precorrin-2 methylase
VPSFCAAAARLNVPLTGGMDTPLTIAPGGWTDRVLEMPGTKVLMKAGRQLPVLLDTLQQADKLKKSALVCNCGLPDERVYPDLSLERPQEQAGYYGTFCWCRPRRTGPHHPAGRGPASESRLHHLCGQSGEPGPAGPCKGRLRHL